MKISDTGYWKSETEFLKKPPENEYAAFSDEGLSYINQSIGLALALQRTSKSNYDITVIGEDGTVATVTEHSIIEAVKRVRFFINWARQNKE